MYEPTVIYQHTVYKADLENSLKSLKHKEGMRTSFLHELKDRLEKSLEINFSTLKEVVDYSLRDDLVRVKKANQNQEVIGWWMVYTDRCKFLFESLATIQLTEISNGSEDKIYQTTW